jgi:ABC-type branched-subunit amino acid transport system ATPase component
MHGELSSSSMVSYDEMYTDRSVAFAYPTRPLVKIFNDLSFEVEPGTNVSIVGPSGGGKSTISISLIIFANQGSLLLRFYDPTSGRITLNGTDIREYSVKQVFAAVILSYDSSDDISQLCPKSRCFSQGRLLKILHMASHVLHNRRSGLQQDGQTAISLGISLMAWRQRSALVVLSSLADRSRYSTTQSLITK